MLQGRPLYDTAADRELFVAPMEAWTTLRSAVDKGFNTVVVGRRGIGKTSLLRQLMLELRDAGTEPPPVFADATSVESSLALFERIREAISGRPGAVKEMTDQMRFATSLVTTQPPGAASTYLVQQVRALADLEPRLVLVDAGGSGEAAYKLFGQLRDEFWQLPHRWVLAVDDEDGARLLRPPADAFFDVTVRLEGLASDELAEMLRRRDGTLDAASRRRIAAASAGSPRTALRTARQAVVESTDPTEVLERQVRLETAASELGRPHSMLMIELQALGAASASDSELLDRLGWTRERATQVFGDLERHGLVIASQEQQARGRPRKVYRPAEEVL